MSRMIFDLTEHDRELLEAHRVKLGLRSHAETLRVLIRRDCFTVEMGGDKSFVVPGEKLTVDQIQIIQKPRPQTKNPQRFSGFTPHPKPGKAPKK